MRRSLFALVMLLSVVARAAPRHAPLPEAILNAKTIYLENQTGAQQATDLPYEEFTRWGRYTVVAERAKADLIVTFRTVPRLGNGTTRESVEMRITGPESPDTLYENSEFAFGFSLPNAHLGHSAKKCVETFIKRMQS